MADGVLTMPNIKVELMDGDSYTVQALNPDMVRFELTAARQKWPTKVTEAPFLWMTFLAWSASQRGKLIEPGVNFDKFREMVALVTQEDGELEAATPTPPAPEAG